MEINSISKITTVVVVLFAINIVCVMLGLVPDSWSQKVSPFDQNVSYNNVVSSYSNNSLNVYTEDLNQSTDATDDASLLSGVPYRTDIYAKSHTFWNTLRNLTVGYIGVLIGMNLPSLMVWLIGGILGFIEFICILMLLGHIFSIIRGGGV